MAQCIVFGVVASIRDFRSEATPELDETIDSWHWRRFAKAATSELLSQVGGPSARKSRVLDFDEVQEAEAGR